MLPFFLSHQGGRGGGKGGEGERGREEEEEGGLLSGIGKTAMETITQLIPPGEGVSVFGRVEAEEGREGEGGREDEDEVRGKVLGEGLKGGVEAELESLCFYAQIKIQTGLDEGPL